jgi:hypothetical protein
VTTDGFDEHDNKGSRLSRVRLINLEFIEFESSEPNSYGGVNGDIVSNGIMDFEWLGECLRRKACLNCQNFFLKFLVG